MAGNVLRQRIPWGSATESTSLLSSEAEAAGIELETIASEGGALAAFESAEAAGAALDSTGIAAPVGIAIGALAAIGYGGYEIYEHFIKSGVPEHKIPSPQQINRNIRVNKPKIEQHKQHLENQKGIDYTETETPEEVNDVETIEKQVQSGLTLPFSNNIGPGNTPQVPKTIADSIALDHDLAYGKAHHPNDVFSADDAFLNQQKTNFLFNGNPIEKVQSAIGYAGIKLKNTFEKHAGVKYPSNLSGKQWPRHSDSRKSFYSSTLNMRMLMKLGNGKLLKLTPNILKQTNTLRPRELQRKRLKDLLRVVETL
uniref:Uncharacterized protein n=1 Tax=Viltain virus TaxID=1955787 RepID=A0A1S5VG84_9VIRU|nr:putative protein 1 [Viltain virus]